MANRNSVQRLIPGNPLGSVLRETARVARRSTRDTTATADCCGDVAALQDDVAAQGNRISALQRRMLGTQLVTGAGGNGTWTFPSPFTNVPVVVATPMGSVAQHCNIVSLTATAAQFQVLDAGGAGAVGVTVNLIAFSRD